MSTPVMKPVIGLVPGDVVVSTRTVAETHRTDTQVVAKYADGSSESWDLAGDPFVEVLDPWGGS